MKPTNLFDKLPIYDNESFGMSPDIQKSSSKVCNTFSFQFPSIRSQKRFTFKSPKIDPLFTDIPYLSPYYSIKRQDSVLVKPNPIYPTKQSNFAPSSFPSFKGERRLNDICDILARIFNGDHISLDFFDLPVIDKELIQCIIDKVVYKILTNFQKKKREKYKVKMELLKRLQTERKYDTLIKELFQTDLFMIKRKEEKVKFISKNTINYFRKQFFKNNDLKSSKQSEVEFMNFYFKEHSQKFNLPVENFSDPLNNNLIPNPRFRSFKPEYLRMLFGTESFRNAFFNHLDTRFKPDYQKRVSKKFRKMMKKLYADLQGTENKSYTDIINEYIGELRTKKAVKLPWVSTEIDLCVKEFKHNIIKVLKTK